MHRDQMSEITVLPGTNRNGKREGFDQIIIRPGDTLSIVGPTGSGKSAFINDIEVLAQADTVTGRRILVNGVPPSDEISRDPSKKPIALITQSTRVIADLDVSLFLELHIEARKQTHIHKLAMVIAASQRDELILTAEDISLANTMVTDLEKDMPKVFAPFRRAGRQNVPGEGMGLAYVQTLVRRHGGRIGCESEPGGGTTFTFTLPHQLAQGDQYDE